MQKDDSIPSAGAEAGSEPKAEVTTSSSNNTKPNVVGSQCTSSVSTEELQAKEKGLTDKIVELLKGLPFNQACLELELAKDKLYYVSMVTPNSLNVDSAFAKFKKTGLLSE